LHFVWTCWNQIILRFCRWFLVGWALVGCDHELSAAYLDMLQNFVDDVEVVVLCRQTAVGPSQWAQAQRNMFERWLHGTGIFDQWPFIKYNNIQ
jgi:hypothetical protein